MTFNSQVWSESFANKLAIRERTAHAVCEICVRHKYILKHLQGDRLAFKAQMSEYARHLKRQYTDRTLYWGLRAASRLNNLTADSTQELVIIGDGMDHSKFRYPRSLCMASKQFDPFLRPHLNMYACLAHGHMALLCLSEMTVAKDASFCLDVMSYCLHCVASRLDLRSTRLTLQSDNTCRELKNNSAVRLLAVWVGTRRLFAAQLSCLQKGHSHEDIDAFFANVAVTIEKYNELHRPEDFRQILQQYLDGGARKHEELKEVVMVDQVRDWWPSSKSFGFKLSTSLLTDSLKLRSTFLNLGFDGAHLKGIGGPGAPHLFCLERFSDTGWNSSFSVKPFAPCIRIHL